MIRVKEIREEAGMSQAELSRKSGVNRMTISLIESGKTVDMKVSTALALALALDCWVEDFFSAQEINPLTSEEREGRTKCR